MLFLHKLELWDALRAVREEPQKGAKTMEHVAQEAARSCRFTIGCPMYSCPIIKSHTTLSKLDLRIQEKTFLETT